MHILVVLLLLGSDPAVTRSTQIGSRSLREWIDTLSSADPGSRRTAAEILMRLGRDAKPAIPALIHASSDPDASVRCYAIHALGAIGPEAREAIPNLIRATTDPDVSVRSSAIRALGSIGPESREVVPALAQASRDARFDIWVAALNALAEIGEPAIPPLTSFLEAAKGDKRSYALTVLATMGPKAAQAVPFLIRDCRASQNDPSARDHRFQLIFTLGRIGPEAIEAESLITRVLKTEFHDAAVTEAAVRALCLMDKPPLDFFSEILTKNGDDRRGRALDLLEILGPRARPLLPVLKRMMEARGKDDLSVWAAAAMSRIDPTLDCCISVLTDAIKDHEWVALRALRRFGPRARSAIPAIRDALRRHIDGDEGNEESMSTDEIIRVLVYLDPDGREILPSLVMALRKGELEVQAYAAGGLGLVGRDSREAVMVLARTLNSAAEEEPIPPEPYDMAECTAIALARIGEKAAPAVPLLIEILRSKSDRKRKAAAIALAGIGPAAEGGTAALSRALDDKDIGLRFAALNALGRIGTRARAAIPSLQAIIGRNSGAAREPFSIRARGVIALCAIDPAQGRKAGQKIMAECPPLDFYNRACLSNAMDVESFESDWWIRSSVLNLRKLRDDYSDSPEHPEGFNHVILPNADPLERTLEFLTRFGPRAARAAPILRDLLEHPDPFIRRRAKEALTRIRAE